MCVACVAACLDGDDERGDVWGCDMTDMPGAAGVIEGVGQGALFYLVVAAVDVGIMACYEIRNLTDPQNA